jgi:hypothetical protein
MSLDSTSRDIDRLLRERQTTALRDRRAADRQPFVRPVQIVAARFPEPIQGFSRDVSRLGVSMITSVALASGTVAILKIHSLFGHHAELRGQLRWCEDYGEGWFVSGWCFLDAV